MFLQKIKSDGIAHLSYILGSSNQAVVIDPRRDIDIYLQIARENSLNITHIFETHRNEDYVIGSLPLSLATGADIYHGKQLDFDYGNPVSEGDHFDIGQIRLDILETPGHTLESISIAMFDTAFGDKAVGVFTGDTLFVGDVGRTDFFPGREEEVAGMLYDSIFKKLLPLGDQTIVYPAHGAGSVCGSGMASREFSTLGYEKMFNPVLQKKDPQEFINYKITEQHSKPPYFKTMEQYNQIGPPLVGWDKDLLALPAQEFLENQKNGLQLLDIRSPEAVAGAYIPSSLAIPLNMIPAFAGWFLQYDRQIGLIIESTDQIEPALKHLFRLGYDNVSAYLTGGLHEWEIEGMDYETIQAIHAKDLQQKIERGDNMTILDVRSRQEYEKQHLPGSINIYLGHLPMGLNDIPDSDPVVTFCGSGRRAIIAASILKMYGFTDVMDCLGSIQACSKIGCDMIK